MPTINFNGQEYDSPEAMPTEVRRLYELANQMFADQDQDGIPDMFEGMANAGQATVIQTQQFIVDGKAYSSLDELPADARRKYEQAIGRLDANNNGVPDLLEGNLFGTAQATASPAAQPAPVPQPAPISSDVLPLGVRVLIAGLVVLLLVGAVLFFLSR